MREKEKKLTHERLLEVLTYDEGTGVFTHRKTGRRSGNIRPAGNRAIRVDYVWCDALRLAYFYAHGSWPEGEVIPADSDLNNARLTNLRVVPGVSPSEFPKRRSDLTIELIRKLFHYEDGRLFWAVHDGRNIRFGMEAGTIGGNGYRSIQIGGIRYQAHQICWAHHYGEWLADSDIDHKDRMKDNNRIENLRSGTRSQNCANTIRKLGNTGIVGIHRYGSGKYAVSCGSSHIGVFVDIESAIGARQAAAKERWGEFAREAIASPKLHELSRPSAPPCELSGAA